MEGSYICTSNYFSATMWYKPGVKPIRIIKVNTTTRLHNYLHTPHIHTTVHAVSLLPNDLNKIAQKQHIKQLSTSTTPHSPPHNMHAHLWHVAVSHPRVHNRHDPRQPQQRKHAGPDVPILMRLEALKPRHAQRADPHHGDRRKVD